MPALFGNTGQKLKALLLDGILLLGLVYLLVGCGSSGGGGGSDDPVPDTTAPTVSPGAQVNAPRNRVLAVFNEAMDATSLNSNTFRIEDNVGTPVSGTVSLSGVTATFTPDVQLASSSAFSATITTGARDASGNPVAAEVSWPFTTASGNIRIGWDANPESAVNRAGGGYTVYRSNTPGFEPGDPGVIEMNVPYVSGALAPTSVVIPLDPGNYYLRVAAYSSLDGGSRSSASPEIMLEAP